MSTETRWQPQQIHANSLTRVAVDTGSLKLFLTDFTGIWFGCFESNDEVQDHPVTMLTRFDAGGFFPLHGHPGGEEILVLDGYFADETGVHPPGTYMLNPEGFIHRPHSDQGCMTFVKLRQHGGKNREQMRVNIFEGDWQPSPHANIEIQPIYTQPGFNEKVWFERWQPGTQLDIQVETEIKEIFVVQGTWQDERGCYPTNTWLRYIPNDPYQPASEDGCLIYVKTYPESDPVDRFVVADDFQHPEETVLWDQAHPPKRGDSAS